MSVKSSSTSNSRTLGFRPTPTATFLLAVWVVVLVRLGLWWGSEAFFLIPENDFDKLYLMNETHYRLGEQPSPGLIVMGTSRLGILQPERLAAQAGIASSEVANYSLAGNGFWRSLAFFRRNPEILRHARVVVIDLLPYQLYRGKLFTEEDELFLRLATLDERLTIERPVGKAKALADLLVPAWSERHNPDGWRQGLALLSATPEERYRRFRAAVERSAPLDLRQEAHEAPVAANPELGRGYAPTPEVSLVQLKALRDLRELMPGDCLLLLPWLPVREDFAAALATDAEMKASYETFRAIMTAVKLPGVRVDWWDNSGGRLMPQSDFTDVVHYTEQGAAKVDEFLAAALAHAMAPAQPDSR